MLNISGMPRGYTGLTFCLAAAISWTAVAYHACRLIYSQAATILGSRGLQSVDIYIYIEEPRCYARSLLLKPTAP